MKRQRFQAAIEGTDHATVKYAWNAATAAARTLVRQSLTPPEQSAHCVGMVNITKDGKSHTAGTLVFRSSTGREILVRIELQP